MTGGTSHPLQRPCSALVNTQFVESVTRWRKGKSAEQEIAQLRQKLADVKVLSTTKPGGVYDFSGVIPLTHSKSQHIIARDAYQITGFVLTHDDGRKCIVDMSAVRWLGKQEFFSMMHGIKTNQGDQT